ncbi:unnamed protein product [Sympodiomycopsis kandeliae]
MQLPLLSGVAAAIGSTILSWSGQPFAPSLHRSHREVDAVLSRHPVLDGHFDLPIVARAAHSNDVPNVPYDKEVFGHVDLPRMRKGRVGGFWSVAYVGCTAADDANNFTAADNSVRDTLEQIDLTKSLVRYHQKDIALARSPSDHRANVKAGKISHWIGVEGGHSLGNSLATLRLYAELGVSYMTLSHTCHNIFADSCQPSEPLHHGLSEVGRRLIREMNRLGVAVDISHTSVETQRQAVAESVAPVIYSHSGAAGVYNHVRNIQDEILHLLKGRETVIGVPFVADFVNGAGHSTLEGVVSHIEYISNILGKDKVSLGSDFDGAFEFAKGLNDTSYYPNLFVALHQKGWSRAELAGLASENFLRVYGEIQQVGKDIRGGKTKYSALPDTKPWDGRNDLLPPRIPQPPN